MKTHIFHVAHPIIDKDGNPHWRDQVRASMDYMMDNLKDAPEEDWKLVEVPEGKATYARLEFKDE
jgi:hypothetical protein